MTTMDLCDTWTGGRREYYGRALIVLAAIAILFSPGASKALAVSQVVVGSTGMVLPVQQGAVASETVKIPIVERRDIRFRRMAGASGLSQTRVSSVVQDADGFMWFGTQYGLNRYDGYKFKIFKHEPGRPDSLGCVNIKSLYKDHLGAIWVGCDQLVDKFDPATEKFTHYPLDSERATDSTAPVVQIYEDRRGTFWLATLKGLYRLDSASGRVRRYIHDASIPSSLSNNYIIHLGEDRRGQFWVATSGGLDAFDGNTGKVTLHIPLGGRDAFTFHEDSFGTFWIARTSPSCALSTLDQARKTVRCYSIYEHDKPVASLAGIYSMLECRDGTMWFATAGMGLFKFDRTHNQLVRYRNHPEDSGSLGSDSVVALYEDNEGDIWTCLHVMEPNFFAEKPSTFETFTRQQGNLAGSLVTTIFEDRNQVLWIGSTGAVNRIDRRTGENIVPRGAAVRGELLSIVEDRSGRLIGGTYRQGLQQIDPQTGQFSPYRRKSSGTSNQDKNPIMRLLFDRLGNLWAATWGGLSRLNESTGEFISFKPDPQNSVDYSDIKEDVHGSLWLGGESGLQRFDPTTGKFTIYRHDPDNPRTVSDNRVTSVYIARSGEMWVGTQNGLDRFDPLSGTFQTFYVRDGLAGNVVSCLLEDRQGNLWMGTNNGLSRFDPGTLKFKNYSATDGLPGPDLTGWSSCFKSSRGEMFFGGFSGATAFFPDKLEDAAYTPRTVITDLQLAGLSVPIGSGNPLSRSITYTGAITLTHRQNIFAIEFAALSYSNPITNRYRYKLEGLDQGWREVGSDQRTATYTTLPTGHYTFQVQGATSRGAWDEPGAVLQIRILPPWWATWWFRTLYITTICLALFLAYQYRLRQIAQQFNLRLEDRLNERTRLARDLHDTLLQTIQASKLITDVALDKPADLDRMGSTLKRLSVWLDRATEEGRAVLNSLRSPGTQQDDLLDALRCASEECPKDNSIRIEITTAGPKKTLHPICREEIYRIGCEAIRNACMHSGGSHIEVELQYGNDFVLRVSDNGKGIPPVVSTGGRQGHFGLQGMKERAHRIGAKLSLLSAPDSGTVVLLRVPSTAYASETD